MSKYLISCTIVFLVGCTTNSFEITPQDKEVITSHHITFERDIKLTSVYARYDLSEKITKINTDEYSEFLNINNSWLSIRMFTDGNFNKCLNNVKSLSMKVNSLMSDNLFHDFKSKFKVYIVPNNQNFIIDSIETKEGFEIYFPQSGCYPNELKALFITILNQVVHESAHLYINRKKIDTLTELKEEEIAHGLELCNSFFSPAFKALKTRSNFQYQENNIEGLANKIHKAYSLSEQGKELAHNKAKVLMDKLSARYKDKTLVQSKFKEEYCEPVFKIFHHN